MKRRDGRLNARLRKILLWSFCLSFFTGFSQAQTLAPGAPGKDAQWATAGKQGVGTSATLESKVWFTLAQGALTEVYYPDVTQANVHLLQFVVVNPKTRSIETETDDAVHEIKVEPIDFHKNVSPVKNLYLNKAFESPSSLSFTQISRSKAKSRNGGNLNGLVVGGDSAAWTLTKNYVTDPENNSVVIAVEFKTSDPDYVLYIYYDPSLGNSGMGDTGWTKGNSLLAQDKDVFSALACRFCKFSETANGFLGVNDGLTQLRAGGKIENAFSRAENGNLVQTAQITPALLSQNERNFNFQIALGFGRTEEAAVKASTDSLLSAFANVKAKYQGEWGDYLKTLPKVDPKYQAQFNMAAMQLKAHEDKAVRGANIASLSVPWGGGANANENNIGGYHLIWSRDLYQVATAFMALGDRDAALRALNFLFKVQQKPDGSFPQNSFLDGKPFWGSLQLDEVAYPLILAHELGVNDRETYEKHVKRAADFIVRNGPKTPQERWEEEAGYSPSTIAAEIAGLICAAEIARKNGDESSALIYKAAADDWARKVEMWTATTNGKYGDGNYYLRITQNGRPDAGEKIELNNGAGFFDEREIIDAGFLELVRLGIKPADDPLIAKSLKVVDEVIRVRTPHGDGFYRYNHDGYGEMDDGRRWNFDGKYTGKGRLWALLSGERGQYELALAGGRRSAVGDQKNQIRDPKSEIRNPNLRLDAMLGFANDGLMIPEQIWDTPGTPKNIDKQFVPELKFGEGTGSATPLAWSMAQFIRLAVNLREGVNLDTPAIVYERYAKNGIPGQASGFGGLDQTHVLSVRAGEKFTFARQTVKNAKITVSFRGETKLVPVDESGKFSLELTAPEKEEIGIVAVETPDGATAFERIKVRAVDRREPQKFSPALIEKIKNAPASPLVDNGRAIVFYRGGARGVTIAGDLTDWNPGRIFMEKIADGLHAVALDLAPTARSEYKLVVDGKWLTDELNPVKSDNGVGGANSVLTMPDYRPSKWLAGKVDSAVEDFEINSSIYGKRRIRAYVPEECSKSACPAVYFQDGSDYYNRAYAVKIQFNLLKEKKIKPFLMVFLDPKDRTKEYWASDEYARFVATEVVPAVDAKYGTIRNREGRAIIGASLGGVTSVWVALKYPEIFARVGGQSSSFWIDDERVVKALAKLDANQTQYRFYFDDGAFEGTEDTRRVCVMLRGKGFPATCAEGETGHNWTSWRDRLAEAFVALMN
ncbi:MAG TPA: glycoside hydrolase family 15 protein [Pyrinomonadaceae bacterium]|jgi:glucoamylase